MLQPHRRDIVWPCWIADLPGGGRGGSVQPVGYGMGPLVQQAWKLLGSMSAVRRHSGRIGPCQARPAVPVSMPAWPSGRIRPSAYAGPTPWTVATTAGITVLLVVVTVTARC